MSPFVPTVSFAKFKPLASLVILTLLSFSPIDNVLLKAALSVSMLFAKAKVTDLPSLSNLAFKFLPALKVKVSPALRAWSSAVSLVAAPFSISSSEL